MAAPKSSSTGPPSIDRHGFEEGLVRPQPVGPWRARPVRPNHDQTNEKGTATVKLTINANVPVDGVRQGISRRESS
jgi:hypothetical protein